MTKRAARADLEPERIKATKSPPTGHRLPRSRQLCRFDEDKAFAAPA